MSEINRMLGDIFREAADAVATGRSGRRVRVGLTILGSEHGPEEMLKGAELAEARGNVQVVAIGKAKESETKPAQVAASDLEEAHRVMESLLDEGQIEAAVTMHYNFPIGVTTIGKAVTPGRGREIYLASTTGTSAAERVAAMLYNAIYGIAVAKTGGKPHPTVGILNLDGARQVERCLKQLHKGGYPLGFAGSVRSDGGAVMRGNDLLLGTPDLMVCDSLTGNMVSKLLSAFTSGGDYEALGSGYGPGVGDHYRRLICIVSRASGAPVIANAIEYAASCVKGGLFERVNEELSEAKKAGLDQILASLSPKTASAQAPEIEPPPAKPVSADIPGIDILQLEDAVKVLWQSGIYAGSGMGCTGPVILVAPEDKEKSVSLLKKAGYL